MDWSTIASWAGAAASLAGTGITVWWPWHTRGRVSIEQRSIIPKEFPE